MKQLTLYILLAITTSFSSCTTYLNPALVGNDIGYQPRAMSTDSIRKTVTVVANYATDIAINSPLVEMGILNIGASRTYTSLNYAYSAFGFAGIANHDRGNYADDPDLEAPRLPSFKKNFYGFGLKTSIGYHKTSAGGKADFRLINWENSVSNESGEYSDLRKSLFSRPKDYYRTYSSKRTFLWTTGLSTEIIFKFKKHHNFRQSIRLLLAATPGVEDSYNKETSIGLYDSNYERVSGGLHYSYFAQYHGFLFGVEAGGNNFATKIGLGYSF